MDLQALIDRRAAYLAAETKILQGQEYSIDVDGSSRRLRRADLSEVRAAIETLNQQIVLAQQAASGRPRMRRFFTTGR